MTYAWRSADKRNADWSITVDSRLTRYAVVTAEDGIYVEDASGPSGPEIIAPPRRNGCREVIECFRHDFNLDRRRDFRSGLAL